MLLLLVILSCIIDVNGVITIPYSDATTCSATQYFQYSSLRCVECAANQRQSGDKLNCVCDNNFKLIKDSGGPLVTCQQCPSGEVATTDGYSCVKCATTYNTVTKTCASCPNGQISVDRQENGSFYTDNSKKCIMCQAGTQPGTSQRVCRTCHQSTLQITSALPSANPCTCPVRTTGGITITQANGICFSSATTTVLSDQPSTYELTYPNGQVLVSAYFEEYIISAQALCKQDQNFTACQTLANLCVLYMYNEDNFDNPRLSSTDACKEYLLIIRGSSITEFVSRLLDWPVAMPWLYYKVNTPIEVLDRADLEMSLSRGQVMSFVLVKYAANGSFIGISKDASDIDICFTSNEISSEAFVFTLNYKADCKIKIEKLWRESETIFYDMYLEINGSGLYPVPVLVENLKSNGQTVNKQSDRTKWKLTRRFFLVDNLSGKTDLKQDIEVIQYAESIELSYRLRDDGLIYPPLLRINYAAVLINTNTIKKDVTRTFKVSYEMNTNNIERNIQIAVGVLSVLGFIYASIRIVSWRRREGTQMLDCSSFIVFIVFMSSALTLIFLAVLISTCLLWLFFFKRQSTVVFVPPTDSQQKILEGLFVSAFIMKLIDIAYTLYSQIYVDIFFVDWERPRGAVSLNTDGQNKNISTPVSIMRTLFVANEWREIQTTRRIKPTLQIMMVLFLLKVVGFEHWSTNDPLNRFSVDQTVDYVGEYNFCLRLAVIGLLYIIVAVVQWIIFGFLFERFVGDVIGDFVDFCSMSNISVFVMSQLHFGYYIHGRSVHGRSDTSLHELYEQFQREEDNLCGKRGLEANTELQTFEVALTTKFRNEYAKIVQPLLSRELQQGRRGQLPSRQNPGLPGSSLSPSLERSVQAYGNINRYLSSFIEHAIRDNDYTVKDKFLLERLLQNELQPPLDKSIFYNDEGHSFTRILLYGQEWSLLIFNFLFFIMVDWISSWNAVLAGVCSYFLDISIVAIRDSLGKKNLASKTMVDERFLI